MQYPVFPHTPHRLPHHFLSGCLARGAQIMELRPGQSPAAFIVRTPEGLQAYGLGRGPGACTSVAANVHAPAPFLQVFPSRLLIIFALRCSGIFFCLALSIVFACIGSRSRLLGQLPTATPFPLPRPDNSFRILSFLAQHTSSTHSISHLYQYSSQRLNALFP